MGEYIARPSKFPAQSGRVGFPETVNQLHTLTDKRLVEILSRVSVQDGVLWLDGKPIEANPVETVYTFGLVGKWFEESSDNEPVFSTHYPGSSIMATVTGTTKVIGQFLNTGTGDTEKKTIAVRLNGGQWNRFPLSNSVQVASNLNPSTRYTIEIVYDGWNQTEQLWENQRKFSIRSLTLDDGASLQYTNRKKNVLFIGDSITAGTKTIDSTDSATGSSSVLTFARMLGEKMNANVYHNAFAGKKVIDPFMRENVKLVSANKPVPNYNIHSVVMMMGTNDYQQPSDTFISNYQLLIDSIRDVYPTQRIYIIGLVENLLSNRRISELKTISQNNQNNNVVFIDTTNLSGVTYTDGLHPNGAGSRVIADYLYPLLVANGWDSSGGGTNPNPEPEPEPEPVPTTNIWTDNGKPASYNPLPIGFHSVPLPGSWAGRTMKLSFKAKSATGKMLAMYNDFRGDFSREIVLTSTLTGYEFTFTLTWKDEGNNFIMKRNDNDVDTDIVMQDISLTFVS